MTAPIRVALVGLGNMGRRHLRTLQADPRFRIVAVVDPVVALPSEPGAVCLRSIEQLPRVDAAIVATPIASHVDITTALLGQVRTLLVEKPLASSYEHARALAVAALATDVRLVVGHVERHNPAVRALREVLETGVIGAPIHLVATRIGGYPAATPGGDVVLDLGVHDLDVLRVLLGPLRVEASACHTTVAPGVCDTAEILLSSQHGASATVHVDWIAPVKVRTLRVTGTQGAAFVDYQAQTVAVVRGAERTEVPVERVEPLRAQLNAFHALCAHGVLGDLCSGEDAAAAVFLAERALAVTPRAWT